MSNIDDKDDWSNQSASLFREARRAHDPTPAESARLTAVLARIQAGKVEPSLPANAGADMATRGATSAMLRLIGSVSLGVGFLAALSFAIVRFSHDAPEPSQTAKPVPTTVASAPPPIAVQPSVVQASELSASAQTSAARNEAQPRTGSQRRRSHVAERQPTSRTEPASAPEASSSAAPYNSAKVTGRKSGITRQQRDESGSTVKPDATAQQAIRRATSSESTTSQEAAVIAQARTSDPILPPAPPSEIAMMKRIQHALHDADFSTALDLCAEHARRWPHGVFELEREGVRAIASCGEQSDDAALRAKRFLTAHPRAPVAMRVSAACATQLMKR